jgi:hypothetical protein
MIASGKNINKIICIIILSLFLLAGCASAPEASPAPAELEVQTIENGVEGQEIDEAGASDDKVENTETSERTGTTQDAQPNDKTQMNPQIASSEPVESSQTPDNEIMLPEDNNPTSQTPALDSPEQPAEQSADPGKVTMTIRSMEGFPAILPAQPVPWEPGDTVLDLLIRVTREKRIHMAHRGRGRTGYVEGIDNLYEFDHGPASGWVYSVNGVFPDRSAGGWEADQGDEIIWWYTLDAGRDVEAVSP